MIFLLLKLNNMAVDYDMRGEGGTSDDVLIMMYTEGSMFWL